MGVEGRVPAPRPCLVRQLRRRPRLVSIAVTPAVAHPAYGGTDDHADLDLSPTAHEIATALAEGPLPSATLRALIGDRSRYQRAAVELQRQLLVTTAGVQEQASGWPSTVLDLTCRRFDVGEGQDHLTAADQFISVVLDASARDLARSFRWPVGKAREHLDALVTSARAVPSGDRYLAPSIAGQFR